MRLLQKALTFDDVLLVPAHSTVLPRDTVLSTKISRGLTLNIPMVSAAMDTVTEANLAIALAQEGGIGFIHKNLSADLQAAEVAKVKRHEAGVVAEPITIGPNMLVGDVIRLAREHRISGLPVVDGKKVLGMVTNRDLRFETRMSQEKEPVSRRKFTAPAVPRSCISVSIDRTPAFCISWTDSGESLPFTAGRASSSTTIAFSSK